MCLIIEKRRHDKVPQVLIDSAWARNHDGYGIMYIYNNRVVVHKGNKRRQLMHDLSLLRDKEAYIHLRMATHGKKDIINTHPFNCGQGVYLMHNGIVDADTSLDDNMSDTWHMVQQVFVPLLKEVSNPISTLRAPWFLELLAGYLGASNRVVLMHKHGVVVCPDNNWYTIQNLGSCKGMRVSNTYAWDYFKLEAVYNPAPVKPAWAGRTLNMNKWVHPYKELDNPYLTLIGGYPTRGMEGTETANILAINKTKLLENKALVPV